MPRGFCSQEGKPIILLSPNMLARRVQTYIYFFVCISFNGKSYKHLGTIPEKAELSTEDDWRLDHKLTSLLFEKLQDVLSCGNALF